MGKRYVTNDTPNMMYVAGRMIAPGEGREVDEPDEGVAAEVLPEPDADAALHELLAGNVAAVTGALAEFGSETLARLGELENAADKPRKGVLAAIADEQIKRADAKLESDKLADPDAAAADATT